MRAEINNAEKVHVSGKKEDQAEEKAPHLPPSARCLGLGDQQISGVCWLFLINFKKTFTHYLRAADSEHLNESTHINKFLS